MSRIDSKISDIAALTFMPISGGKAVKATKIACVASTVVFLGVDGVVYSSAVTARTVYQFSSDSLDRTLDACIKLGILSAAAVQQHKADMTARWEAKNCQWHAQAAVESMEKLGIPLNKTQLSKLNKHLKANWRGESNG